jgi:glycosyltransferase involved in cell wall biosynthesis
MTHRVLHVTAQRPGWTGSGVTLEALARVADRAGWIQAVVAGVPVSSPGPRVGSLVPRAVHTLTFGASGDLPFAVPGMSDVMPYPSRVWSTLDPTELMSYVAAWRHRLASSIRAFRPDVIHVHHAWVVASILPDVAAGIPIVVHGHGTGLRQLVLCPHLSDTVVRGVARAEGCVVLHEDHAARYASTFGFAQEQVTVVGAGFDQSHFHARGRETDSHTVLYAGKWSDAKGLPQLLDAADILYSENPEFRLLVAGGGSGVEADALRARIDACPGATALGQLSASALADYMRRAAVFVLPSLFEGLPLVLVEAAACGCRVVATDLPGVVHGLAGALGERLELVELPELEGPDRIAAGAETGFIERLCEGLSAALRAGEVDADPSSDLAPFTWDAVGGRVIDVWDALTRG